MAPRRRTQTPSDDNTQVEQHLQRLRLKFLPESTKTPPVHLKFAPHLHDVFSFTSQLTLSNADPTRIHECLQDEAKEWYDKRLGEAAKIGLATGLKVWTNELERVFRYTAGKASVSLPQEEQEQQQEQHDTKHNTQTASTSAQPNPQQITMQPPEQHAPGNDTQHNTQKPSSPPHPNPQPNTVQTPEQPASPAPAKRRAPPAPERFKQKVDYKYDGPCIMRHCNKLINTVDLNTVKFMMSTPHLIQLQHQVLGGFHFAYFWSNSRPPGHPLITWFERTLTRLNHGHHGNRLRLSHSDPSNPRQFSGTWFRHFSIFPQHAHHPRSFLKHHLTDSVRLHTRGFINITSTSEALVMVFFDWWIALGARSFFCWWQTVRESAELIHAKGIRMHVVPHRLGARTYIALIHSLR